MPSESANRIKHFRKSLDLTQRAFAKEIGSSQGTVGNNEASDKDPAKPFLDKIFKRYGVSIDWVLTGRGEPVPGNTDPIYEQAQSLAGQFQEMLPPKIADALEIVRQYQALQSADHDQRLENARLIDALPALDPDESMAAIREHPAAVPAEGSATAWRMELIALPRPWLLARQITAPALVYVPDDDMAPTFDKGDVLLIDGNDTEIDGTPDPRAILLDGKLIIRRMKPIEGWIILTADRPGTMAYEIKVENGAAIGLDVLGRVKVVINSI